MKILVLTMILILTGCGGDDSKKIQVVQSEETDENNKNPVDDSYEPPNENEETISDNQKEDEEIVVPPINEPYEPPEIGLYSDRSNNIDTYNVNVVEFGDINVNEKCDLFILDKKYDQNNIKTISTINELRSSMLIHAKTCYYSGEIYTKKQVKSVYGYLFYDHSGSYDLIYKEFIL